MCEQAVRGEDIGHQAPEMRARWGQVVLRVECISLAVAGWTPAARLQECIIQALGHELASVRLHYHCVDLAQ